MDDPLGKKILQIRTANFANSEINSQVPPVSLKAELTVSKNPKRNLFIINRYMSLCRTLVKVESPIIRDNSNFLRRSQWQDRLWKEHEENVQIYRNNEAHGNWPEDTTNSTLSIFLTGFKCGSSSESQ